MPLVATLVVECLSTSTVPKAFQRSMAWVEFSIPSPPAQDTPIIDPLFYKTCSQRHQ